MLWYSPAYVGSDLSRSRFVLEVLSANAYNSSHLIRTDIQHHCSQGVSVFAIHLSGTADFCAHFRSDVLVSATAHI